MKRILLYLRSYEKQTLILIVIFALLARVVFVYLFYANNGMSKWSDDLYYLSMGEQIAYGNWEPQSENRPQMVVDPIIPLLIALFIKLFNNPIIPMFIYNLIIGSSLVLVLYKLGEEVFNKKTGWFMAIWGALFIESFKYSPHILKEPTLFLFLPLTILLLIKSIRNNYSFKYIVLSSLSYTWLIHTDERFFVYFPIFALSFFLVKPLRVKNFFKPIITWTGLVLLLMLPWGIRNYIVFDQVVILTPRTTVFTSKLWGTNLEKASSHFIDDNSRENLNMRRYKNAMEFGNRYGITPYEQSKNEARVRAFFNFWQPTYFKPTFIQYGFRSQKWSFGHNAVGLLFYGIFLPFYLVGIILLFKKKHFIGLLLAGIPIIHSVLHAYMVWPLERYRSPVTFIVVLIGTWTAISIYQNKKRKVLSKLFRR